MYFIGADIDDVLCVGPGEIIDSGTRNTVQQSYRIYGRISYSISAHTLSPNLKFSFLGGRQTRASFIPIPIVERYSSYSRRLVGEYLRK